MICFQALFANSAMQPDLMSKDNHLRYGSHLKMTIVWDTVLWINIPSKCAYSRSAVEMWNPWEEQFVKFGSFEYLVLILTSRWNIGTTFRNILLLLRIRMKYNVRKQNYHRDVSEQANTPIYKCGFLQLPFRFSRIGTAVWTVGKVHTKISSFKTSVLLRVVMFPTVQKV